MIPDPQGLLFAVVHDTSSPDFQKENKNHPHYPYVKVWVTRYCLITTLMLTKEKAKAQCTLASVLLPEQIIILFTALKFSLLHSSLSEA